MSHSPILKILCVRHGKTNYTGIFPDLTDEGIAHIRHIANNHVAQWVDNLPSRRLNIVSSPAPRARGTAWVIAEEIGYTMPATIRDEIDAMQWKDKERCLDALKGLWGKGYIDYETEPVFADPTLFEIPGEIRARWYAFLGMYINKALASVFPEHAILVSHYEVFCNITRDLFGIVASEQTALGYGEPIELSISLTSDPILVNLSGIFRGQEVVVTFDLSSHTIYQA